MLYLVAMAIPSYVGWATGVNRTILDSTSLAFGENALKNDELENGHKRSRKRSAFCPDRFTVKMVFDWVNHVYINGVDTGKTEFQLFTEWYKYVHKYGSVPFEFPRILYSQNTGILVVDNNAGNQYVEYYKITSAVNGQKSGECIEIDMTWETVYGGIVSIDTPEPEVQAINGTPEYVDILFSTVASSAPTNQMFTIYIDDEEVEKKGFYWDGDATVRIYYDYVVHGAVTFAMDYLGSIVVKDMFISEW